MVWIADFPRCLQGMIGSMVSPAMTPQTNPNAMSAPAAFQQNSHMAAMDMGFSPLTSPALEPTIGVTSNQRLYTQREWSNSMSNLTPHNGSPQSMDLTLPNDQQLSLMRTGTTPNKRPVPEEANAPPARKRQSPLFKATVQQNVPAPRKTRGRKADIQQGLYNTPSPIDMDTSLMPPPAPPAGPEPDPSRSSSSSNNNSPDLEPLTPATMMNMRPSARHPTGLRPGADLPLGPMTAQQQQLAEALTRDGGMQPDHIVDVAASKKGKPATSATSATKGKNGPATGGSRSTKPSPVIRANSGSVTPKTILPSGESFTS